MKRKIFIILLIAVLFGVTGCRRGRNAAIDGDKINVTTTIFAPYDFVRNIAGDRVNLTMLLSPGAESHSFEPSPQDIITMMNSNIFIYVGGESDDWVKRILDSMDTQDMKILAMMDVVDPVTEVTVEGMQRDHDDHHDHGHHGHHDHHHGHHDDHDDHHEHGHYDEHVWTSPVNAIQIVTAIAQMLIEADPANAEFYRANTEIFVISLAELDVAFRNVVTDAARRTIVFGDRFPFRYFTDAYGLEYFAAFPGCSTETEPSAATVAFLINKIRSERIPVVFHIELSNERMADTISGETGARKLMLHSVHNLTKQDFDAGLGYIDFMRRNVENLRIALN